MESLHQQQMVEFWKEVTAETRSVSDPIFLDYLESIDSHRMWSLANDDNLKAALSTVNRLLNETKSRPLGLTVLNQFIQQVNSNRFLIIQDSLNSGLHIVVKYIDQELVQKLLVNILPKCHKVLELNQTLSNSIIPKILVHLSAVATNDYNKFTIDEVKILKICLSQFHGPCGNYRNNLEKILIAYIDSSSRTNEAISIFKIIPLLSSTGGGGNKRDKHGQDWYNMVVKVLRAMHDTILQLYSDACPSLEEHNPYETEFGTLELPTIHEKNVFLRYSLLKKRLENLADLLGCYLSEPFPAPKPVPFKSILNIICKMIVVNPVDLLKSKAPKEFVYLAGILPSIHESALHLLNNLISCAGPNLLAESARIEQLSVQEFKWISKTPQTFMKLKVGLYKILLTWFKVTHGFVTTTKTLAIWVDQVRVDMKIEKNTVELNLKSNKSKFAKKSVPRVSSQTQALSNILTSNEKIYLEKSSDLCAVAIEFLEAIIPVLEKDSHRLVYELVSKTIMEFSQEPVIPCPYDQETCRINIFKCVQSIALNPHPKSPISLGILANLARQNLADESSSVVKMCYKVLSTLERIAHPVGPTFNFPSVFKSSDPEVIEIVDSDAGKLVHSEDFDTVVDTREMYCQTEETELPVNAHSPNQSFSQSLPYGLTEAIQATVRQSVEQLISEIPHNYQTLSAPTYHDQSYSSTISSPSKITTVNGFTKRKADTTNHIDVEDDGGDSIAEKTAKKFRNAEPEVIDIDNDNDDCRAWLNDFVNLSPDPQ